MKKFLDTVETGFERLISFLIAMVAISIGLFALSIPFNTFLVKIGVGGIWWLNEAIEYALYAGVFLGAPYVLSISGHVRVDILASNLPRDIAVKLEKLVDSFGVIICATLCFYGARAAIWEFDDGTLPDKILRIPNWYILVIFSFSFFLMTIEFLFRIRRAKSIVIYEETHITQAGM